ncbi:MAG: DUF4173 domain-containing protein [Bacteroidota bacterium]|nr:DUF4173 domain-containing protein [Bacteroidota bacterium]
MSLLLATLFAWLFHEEGIGYNLLVYEVAALAILWSIDRPQITVVSGVVLSGTLLSAIAIALHGSTLAIWVNLISVIVLAGVLLAPKLNAVNYAFVLGIGNVLRAQRAFVRSFEQGPVGRRLPGFHRRTVVGLLVVAMISWAFSKIYQASNPHFDQLVTDVGVSMAAFFDQFDLALMGTFLFGLAVSNFILQRNRNENIPLWMARSNDQLFRRRQKPSRVILGLRYELRTGVLLLGILNLLLLIANFLDLKHVWFGFTFNGQYLKQFVHEGTVLLILSIVFGAGIVLYFFRANQNFHRGNRTLKILAYIWLAQNALLAASVGMRNFWYIQHYALAYKRIGVMFFLLACLLGLFLVFRRVHAARSNHYLFRWQAYGTYVILVLLACFDLDVLIARYNFSARDHAFVHLDFLATLDDKALPWLIQDATTLKEIDLNNQKILNDTSNYDRTLYMTPQEYLNKIAERKEEFINSYPKLSWKSQTLADSRAYDSLAGSE